MTDTPRYHVFLSHHEQDETAARLIAERLRTEYGIESWLRAWSAIPGRLTQEEQERGLAESTACAVLIGAAGVRQWQQMDVYAAISRRSEVEGGNFPVIPVFLPECPAEAQEAMPAMLRLFEPVRLATLDDQPGLARLAAGVRGEPALSASITLPDEPAPYRGLLPFEAEHARFFFGRDDDVRRLVDKLGQQRFVAVVGASGSGKSSLVMAGLLPRLVQNALPDSARWKVLQMTPDSEPLRSLANQLATLAPPGTDRLQAADALVERLGARQDGLRSAAAAYLAEEPRSLLLFVDQFEELFTQCAEGPERCRTQAEQFVANLVDAVQQGGGQIRVLITLRADFLDRCLALPALRGLLEDRQVLLGPMDEPALREAIVRPARQVSALFEKGLVSLILRDVGDEPGRLPLLEHALHELWLARRGPWLTLDAYETSGGVQGALNRRAQATYDALDAEQQRIARNILLRLAALGEGVADMRRRARREDLYTVGVAREEVDAVVQALVDGEARLLVADGESVQVAHEALIQGWDTLRRWLEEDRDALGVQRRLAEAAAEWVAKRRDAAYLYRGARLAEAEEWVAGDGKWLNEVEAAFAKASIDLRDQEAREKEGQEQLKLEQVQRLAEEQRLRAEEGEQATRRLRRRFWFAVAATVIALVFLVVAGMAAKLAMDAQQQAEVEAENALIAQVKAEAQARRAQSAELSVHTQLELSKPIIDPSLALLLAQKAVESTWPEDGYVLANADRALLDAIGLAPPWQMTLPRHRHGDAVNSANYSPDGTKIITASSDGTVRIWDVARGHEVRTIASHGDAVNSANYSPDGTKIITAGSDGTVRIWGVASGYVVRTIAIHNDTVNSANYKPNGLQVVTASSDGTARIWNAASGEEMRILRGHSGGVNSAAYSPDGLQVVTASSDGTARIWDAVSGTEMSTLSGHGDRVNYAVYSPDGLEIVTVGDDRTAIIWDAASGQGVRTIRGHSRAVNSAAWSPDGRQIVTASDDMTANIWNAANGQTNHSLGGHGRGIRSVTYSRDGRLIVTASWDGTARIWDAVSGQQVRTLTGHNQAVTSADWRPDSKQIVTSSRDQTAHIWDVANGQVLLVLRGHSEWINSAAYSPNGRRIITASSDQTARIWDAESGQEERILRGHNARVNSAAYSIDGQQIVTAGADGTARIWDANNGLELHVLRGHRSWVSGAVYSPDSLQVVTASSDGTARIWDAASGYEVHILSGHSGWVNSAAYSPDGRQIVTASADGTARIWDATTGEVVRTLSGHGGSVWSATYSPDGQQIVTASEDQTVRVWDATRSQQVRVLRGHNRWVTSAAFNPDGKQIVTASWDGTARIWDTKSGQEVHTLQGHISLVTSAAFSPECTTLSEFEKARHGKQIVTGSWDGTARIWDAASGLELHTLNRHNGWVNSVAYSPDCQLIVTGSSDRVARIWDVENGRELRTLSGHDDQVTSATYSPDGLQIVTASADGTARIWDAATGESLYTLGGHSGSVTSAAYSPDGNQIVTASGDGAVRIWDATTGEAVRTLSGHSDGVTSAAYSPDGNQIVTASGDGTVRIWDAANGEMVRNLSSQGGAVNSAAYSPDGRFIVTASGDGTARIWIASIEELLAEAERLIQRDPPVLTPEERRRFGLEH